MKNLGKKFGAQIQDVVKALASADVSEVAAKVSAGQSFELTVAGQAVTLEPADVVVNVSGEEGWAGLMDRKTQLALDTRITEELKLEGLAREVIRHVQTSRKEANLNMEDRIVLRLSTDADDLRRAIEKHRDYLGQETLVSRWSETEISGEGAFRATVKIEGAGMEIELRKHG
jgi:isoleucyl-tRNA synthetase